MKSRDLSPSLWRSPSTLMARVMTQRSMKRVRLVFSAAGRKSSGMTNCFLSSTMRTSTS